MSVRGTVVSAEDKGLPQYICDLCGMFAVITTARAPNQKLSRQTTNNRPVSLHAIPEHNISAKNTLFFLHYFSSQLCSNVSSSNTLF